jgi:hypothetical protein
MTTRAEFAEGLKDRPTGPADRLDGTPGRDR